MLALREAVLGLLLGASFGPAMAFAEGPARPNPAPAAPVVPAAQAASGTSTAHPPSAIAAPAQTANPPAPGSGTTPPTDTPPPPVAVTPPGSIGGQLLLQRGGVPKHSVAYLESVAAGSWSVPRERVTVSLRGMHFAPEFLVVPVGQTVQLTNADRLMHSPFSISPVKSFELSRHAPGESHTLTFDRLGVVDLFCNIHDTMQGMIVVVPSTFYALPAPDGSFQIGGVPPGRYRLIAYSPEAESFSQAVEVHSRERTVVKLQLGPLGSVQPSSVNLTAPAAGRERLK